MARISNWKGQSAVKKKACCGCQACQDICPAQAIRMQVDSEGFWYPVRDEEQCVHCMACERVCPMAHADEKKRERMYVGVQAKENGVRFDSSSGGMFSVLADFVLKKQGVVYGAGFNSEMRVIHKGVFDQNGLKDILKTKYVQSDMGGIYLEVLGHLRAGKWVLFCGTPCQVRGMKLFLGEDFPRLILADLICYGAASPGVWRSYAGYLERRDKGKLERFSFRDKRNKDSGRTCSYVINGKERTEAMAANLYCRLYFANYLLRPACHSCGFCTVERDSDFTLGDFWGIEKKAPEWNDGMGTSLVMIHTEKAEEIWRSVRESVRWILCEKKEILQPRLIEPTKRGRGRKFFMKAYRTLPFWLLAKTGFGDKRRREVTLYLLFGALTFLISVSSFALFHLTMGMNELAANVCSWIAAVLFAFFTNRGLVFEAPTGSLKEFFMQAASFFGGRAATLLIEEGILYLFITVLRFASMPVKITAQIIVIAVNYVISKLVVFRKIRK